MSPSNVLWAPGTIKQTVSSMLAMLSLTVVFLAVTISIFSGSHPDEELTRSHIVNSHVIGLGLH